MYFAWFLPKLSLGNILHAASPEESMVKLVYLCTLDYSYMMLVHCYAGVPHSWAQQRANLFTGLSTILAASDKLLDSPSLCKRMPLVHQKSAGQQ